MKTLYIDCGSGVCADMILSGFRAFGAETDAGFEEEVRNLIHHGIEHGGFEANPEQKCAHPNHDSLQGGHVHGTACGCEKEHLHHHAHGASYAAIREVLRRAPMTEGARQIAERIYETIARAEAKVHGATLETVHFHEVGRPQAILNIVSAAAMLEQMGVDRIVCSEICDGQGTIECSHGVIPVPVPAVRAMMADCDYAFRTIPVNTELVTPSGLAMLIGMGAEYAPLPDGGIIARAVGHGGRDTGKNGMELLLIEEDTPPDAE